MTIIRTGVAYPYIGDHRAMAVGDCIPQPIWPAGLADWLVEFRLSIDNRVVMRNRPWLGCSSCSCLIADVRRNEVELARYYM